MKTRIERIEHRWMQGRGYHVLLGMLLGEFVFLTVTEELRAGARIVTGFFLLILLQALLVATRSRTQLWVGALLFLPAALRYLVIGEGSLLGLSPELEEHPTWRTFEAVASAIFLFYLVALTILRVFQQTRVTWSQVSAAASGYLLLGYAWRGVYLYIHHVDPEGSFRGVLPGEAQGDLFYYSFVTLTTLGYGDIVPVSAVARTFTVLEAIIGQLFLVILLARLVGLVGPLRDGEEN